MTGGIRKEVVINVKSTGPGFEKLNQGFLSISQAAGRARSTLNGTLGKLKSDVKDIGKGSPELNKGGFLAGDGFLNLNEFGRQAELFGKKVGTSFETVKSSSKNLSANVPNKELRMLENNFKKVQGVFAKDTQIAGIKKKMEGFGGALGLTSPEFKFMNQNTKEFNKEIGTMSNRVRMGTSGIRGFKMELLGVLFFGMAVAQLFGSMLRPAAEMFGFFELWTLLLQVIFLPIMEKLLPIFLAFIDFFINLPEGVQLAIGAFVLFGFILGKLLFLIGVIGLGLGSIFEAGFIAKIAGAGKAIAGFFGGFSAGALGVFAVIGVILLGIFLAFRENFGNIRAFVERTIEGIKQIFKGVFNVIKGIIKVFTSIIKGDFEGVVEGVKQIFGGLIDIVVGIFRAATGLIGTIALGVFRVVAGIWNTIIGFIEKAIDLGKKALNFLGFDFDTTIGTDFSAVKFDLNNESKAGSTANIVNNFNGFTEEEFQRKLDERDKLLVDEINSSSERPLSTT